LKKNKEGRCRAPGHGGVQNPQLELSAVAPCGPPRGLRCGLSSVEVLRDRATEAEAARAHRVGAGVTGVARQATGACRTRNSSSAPQPHVQANPPRGLRCGLSSVEVLRDRATEAEAARGHRVGAGVARQATGGGARRVSGARLHSTPSARCTIDTSTAPHLDQSEACLQPHSQVFNHTLYTGYSRVF